MAAGGYTGSLNFDTSIDTSGFTNDANKLSSEAGNIGKSVASGLDSAAKGFSGLSRATAPITAAVGGLGVASIKTSVDFLRLKESANVAFTTMLGSGEAATAMMDDLYSFAKTTPFSYDVYLQAGQAMMGMGVAASDTIPYLQAITDATVGIGGAAPEMQHISDMFAKMTAVGKVYASDLNQLGSIGIPALNILANSYGVTTEEITKMSRQGKLMAEDVLPRLVEGMNNGTDGAAGATQAFGGMAEAMKGTLGGSIDTLMSRFRNMSIEMLNAEEAYPSLIAVVQSLTNVLDAMPAVFSAVGAAVAPALDAVANGLQSFSDWAETASDGQLRFVGNLILGAAAISPMSFALSRVIGTVRSAITAFDTLSSAATKIKDSKFAETVGSWVSSLGKLISQAASSVVSMFTKTAATTADTAATAANTTATAANAAAQQTTNAIYNTSAASMNTATAAATRTSTALYGTGTAATAAGTAARNTTTALYGVGSSSAAAAAAGASTSASLYGTAGAATTAGTAARTAGTGFTVLGNAMRIALPVIGILTAVVPLLYKAFKDPQSIIDGFNRIKDGISNFASSVATNAPYIAARLGEMVSSFITETIPQFIAAIPRLATSIGSAALSLGTSIITGIGQGIQQLPSIIAGIGSSIMTGLQEAPAKIEAFSAKSQQAIQGFSEYVATSLPEAMANVTENITTTLEGVSDALPGVIEGITNSLVEGLGALTESLPEMIAGIAESITTIIGSIAETLPTLIASFSTIFTEIIGALAEMLPTLITSFVEIIPMIIEAITTNLPLLVESFVTIIQTLIEVITTNLPMIIEAFISIILLLVGAIIENLPVLIEAFIMIIDALVTAISDNIDVIIEAAIMILETLIEAFTENIDTIIDAAILILETLIDGIIDNLPKIIDAAIELLTALVEGIIDNLPKIIDAAIELVLALADAIVDNGPKLWNAAGELIFAILEGIAKALWKLLQAGADIVKSILDGIGEKVSDLWDKAVEVVTDFALKVLETRQKIIDAGKDLIAGLWEGIKDKWNALKETVGNFVGGITDFVKDKFGINSPSKIWAAEIGEPLMEGIAYGIDNGYWMAERAAVQAANKLTRVAAKAVTVHTMRMYNQTVGMYSRIASEAQKNIDLIEKRLEIMSEQQYIQNDRLSKEENDARKKRFDDNQKALKKELDAQKDYYANQIKLMEDWQKDYESALDAVMKKQQSYSDKLRDFNGLIYDPERDGAGAFISEGNSPIVRSLEDDIAMLEKFQQQLRDLRERGTPDYLLDEIAGMSMEDAMAFSEGLLTMADSAWSEYMSQIAQKKALADRIAAEFYKDELDNIDEEYLAKLPSYVNNLKDDMHAAGLNLAWAIAQGFREGVANAVEPAMQMGMNKAVGKVKGALKINSPSKVGLGIGDNFSGSIGAGFLENIRTLERDAAAGVNSMVQATNDALAKVAGGRQLGSAMQGFGTIIKDTVAPTIQPVIIDGGNDTTTTIEFTGSLSGLGQVLQPVIKQEDRRQGASLINGVS